MPTSDENQAAREAVVDNTMRRMVRTIENDLTPDLEMIINATPSGERRNKITDANIYIGRAQAILKELVK